MEKEQVQGLCSFIMQALLLLIAINQANAKGIFASVPTTPCQAPLQWEGRIVVYDHNTGKNTRATVSYDAQMQRIRILEERKSLVPCKR